LLTGSRENIPDIFINGLFIELCTVLLVWRMSGFRGFGHPIFLMLILELLTVNYANFWMLS